MNGRSLHLVPSGIRKGSYAVLDWRTHLGAAMRRSIPAILSTMLLAGCGAGAQYAMNEYSGLTPVSFEVPDEDTYRVFDKPAQNKLMITPSIGKAASAGALQGLTFGGVDAMDSIGPKPMFEKAALGYLASTGRTCRIVDGYIVVRPQWEFKYDCSPPAAAPISSPKHGVKRERT